MSDVELIASYWTFAGGALPHSDAEYSTFEFKERCEAVARAGFKGIGLWHADKLGIPYEDVMRFPAQYFLGLELNDGYLKTPAGMEMVTETTSHRKLCGYGEFDIKGFTSKLPGSPYRGPIGIEVLSHELRSWPLEKTATTAFNTTRAQFP